MIVSNVSPQKRKISIRKVLITSFLVDMSDVLLNLFAALISGSITMVAQALEGSADLLSSGLLLYGSELSRKPADRAHPYGYGREIYFWSFLSGLVTFVITGTLAFYWGLQRFLNPEPIYNLGLNCTILTFSIFSNGYSCSLSYKRLFGKIPRKKILDTFMHSALIETKTAFVQDMMGTVASIFGLFALVMYGVTGNNRFDGVGAMITGLSLAFFAFFILKGAKELLVGQSASAEQTEKIIKIAESFSAVEKVIDIKTIFVGSGFLLINLEIHVKDSLNTDDIEKLIDKIEKKISESFLIKTKIQVELETPLE